MENKNLFLILGVTILASFVFLISSSGMFSSSIMPSVSTPLDYNAQVCIYKTPWLGSSYGEKELVQCSHNVLYNNGANLTREALGVGGTGPIKNISLCNATAGCGTPVAGASEAFTAYIGCGLTSVQGTYAVVPTSGGNWSIYNTFTSSCDALTTNSTRLTNLTGGLFAGNTFTLVTLQNLDQLTVNWTISVS